MPDPPTAPGATPDGGATPPAAAAVAATPPASTAGDDGEAGLGEAGKRAIAEMRRVTRAAEKEAEELRAQVRQFQDASRTDSERLTAERDDWKSKYESEVVSAKRFALATRVAVEEGLDADLWNRLQGQTEEELREDAKVLAERFGKATPSPARDLGAGARPSGPATGHEAFNQRIRRGGSRS